MSIKAVIKYNTWKKGVGSDKKRLHIFQLDQRNTHLHFHADKTDPWEMDLQRMQLIHSSSKTLIETHLPLYLGSPCFRHK